MKAGLYARVSSDEQAMEGFSVRGQGERLTSYAKSQGWTVHKLYKDEGFSAKDLNRPSMQQMMEDIKYKRIDVVLVYKLDRLVRSITDLHELLKLFEEHNVKFKSATESFDTTTATGRVFISMVALFAQWELEQLKERTIFGMERKFSEGQRNGGRAPYGYTLKKDGLEPNENAKHVKWMFEQAINKGKRVIARELNERGIRTQNGVLWNPYMVDYILKNPVYYGHLRWKYRTKKGTRTYEEITIPGSHDPIITEEQYKRVHAERKERQGKGHSGFSIYPFSSLLKCHRCGNNFVGGKRKRKDDSIYRFYKCNGRFMYGQCDMPIVGENVIEDELMKQLEYMEVEIEAEEENFDRKQTEKELQRSRNRIARLKEVYIDGDLTKQEYRKRLDEEREKESGLLQTLEGSVEPVTQEDFDRYIESIKENWPRYDVGKKKEVIRTLFESLTIEVLNVHRGGKGKQAEIELTGYNLR